MSGDERRRDVDVGAVGDEDVERPVGAARALAAPQLRETADIWWDSGHDPVITWDASGRRYWLVDGGPETEVGDRLTLLTVTGDAPADPAVIARALRDGLAACDFPPTEPGVPAHRAESTLRAAGVPLERWFRRDL